MSNSVRQHGFISFIYSNSVNDLSICKKHDNSEMKGLISTIDLRTHNLVFFFYFTL